MRNIKQVQCEISRVSDIPTDTEFTEWLNRRAAQHNFSTALAFADDGVIWGRFDGVWKWSGDALAVSPPFRLNTLQQIRLFGADAELFLWRADRNWQGRVIVEGAGEMRDYFDEAQLLWGTAEGASKDGFIELREGGQGLRHTPPAHIARARKLQTRSYLEDDNDGCVKIIASRLWVDAAKEMTK
jgi:CRISPR-associated protein (TIGR03984 family)